MLLGWLRIAVKDQEGLLAHACGHGQANVGLRAIVGRMDCRDDLCEWAGCGPSPCMLVLLDHGAECYRDGQYAAQDAFE